MQYIWNNTNLLKLYSKKLYLKMFSPSQHLLYYCSQNSDINKYKYKEQLGKRLIQSFIFYSLVHSDIDSTVASKNNWVLILVFCHCMTLEKSYFFFIL